MAQPVNIGSLDGVMVGFPDASSPPPPSDSFYLRPGDVDRYNRPDGTSFYLRP